MNIESLMKRGRRIIVGVSEGKYLLLVPVESRAKVSGKKVEVKIKDTKNPFEQIKLLAC